MNITKATKEQQNQINNIDEYIQKINIIKEE
jgi:hypothetical protein